VREGKFRAQRIPLGFSSLAGDFLALGALLARLAYHCMAPDRTLFGSIIRAPYD